LNVAIFVALLSLVRVVLAFLSLYHPAGFLLEFRILPLRKLEADDAYPTLLRKMFM
jgi:hypothetical protein